MCLTNARTVASEKSQATAGRICREGQRFLLEDLLCRRDGFSSKNLVLSGQANTQHYCKEGGQTYDVWFKTIESIHFCNAPQEQICPLHFIFFPLYHNHSTCNETQSCKCTNVKWKTRWYINSCLLGDRRRALFCGTVWWDRVPSRPVNSLNASERQKTQNILS